jgi:hypothetical protein
LEAEVGGALPQPNIGVYGNEKVNRFAGWSESTIGVSSPAEAMDIRIV